MGVLPEAEENGTHAQEREANCSMQCKITKLARMLITAGGHTVPSTEHGKRKKKKMDFYYSEKKLTIRKLVF